ncbi:MAG TPA: ATP-binding protein [Gemmatimonadaceae bacterium]
MSLLLSLRLEFEHDVVLARRRAREVAAALRLDTQDQTRLATAVSELTRNAYQYAGGGRVEFALEPAPPAGGPAWLTVRVSDEGPGIADLDAVLGGAYRSSTGMGLGLVGARRLSDRFDITSRPGAGTTVTIGKRLPAGAQAEAVVADALAVLVARPDDESAFAEVRRQNQELLRTLAELQARQAEIERLNAELAETSRGVLALYAELDDRAQDLKRANEVKSRFLSDVSHELRTPLTSVLNLSRMLLDRTDGALTEEQERQVQLIRSSVGTVTDLVNDLLDLAKIEAGRAELRHGRFTASELFTALRGMFRPLQANHAVTLVFEQPVDVPLLETDEGRLSQVLRNFVSNALKFTEHGEIRVSASREDGGLVRFAVRDTGLGIAPEDQERIFQEYVQVDSRLQRRVRGTGLGLPLARQLAQLLGGRVELESTPGVGSTFALVVPARHPLLPGVARTGTARDSATADARGGTHV